ncbi:MAG TPA: GNAT family N-acetyltransferase [Candidatus Thermoplasmatota archaeon]|nr:GNAT family N-acetyltransferase [Candidatus Thermoplasmatota archaeon]
MTRVRWARDGDAKGVQPLFEASMVSEGLPMNLAAFRRTWRHAFGPKSTFRFVVAVDASRAVVGCCTVHTHYSTYRGQPVVEVEDVYVVEPRRGRGIGAKLLGFCEKYAESIKAARTELHVRQGNRAARLYLRQGYEPVDYEWMQKPLRTLMAASGSGGRAGRGVRHRNKERA